MSRTLGQPTLCLVTDLSVTGDSVDRIVDGVAAAVAGGVNMVQIRAPELPDEEFRLLVDKVEDSVDERAIKIVNPSRREVTDIRSADGIQLAESAAMDVSIARKIFGAGKLIGRSVHSVPGAIEASDDGADFLILGTVFPSASHPDGATIGASGVSEVAEQVEIPVIAIGGISPANAGSVMRSGASGVAVVRAILSDPHPEAAARQLWGAINEV